MKVCLIQPKYGTDYSKSDEFFNAELELLEKCDSSLDLIVLPESADIPCLAKTREEAEARKYLDMGIDTILTNEYNLISQILK